MVDAEVEAVARAIWDAWVRDHADDTPWEDAGRISPDDYHAVIASARAAIAALDGVRGWRPMSEAPCDGTYIALNVNGQIRPARWMLPEDEVHGQWYAWLDFFGPTRIHPTAMLGWMPLPPAPEDAP